MLWCALTLVLACRDGTLVQAKEILAGLVGAEDESSLSFSWRKADTLSLDKLAETKGALAPPPFR